MAGGGDALSSLGGLAAADMQKSAAKIQNRFYKNQAEFNNKILEFKKTEILEQSERDAERISKEAKQIMGSQKVAAAAQGIDVEGDMQQALERETRDIALEDQDAIRNNAWRSAWGIQNEQDQVMQQARFDALERTNAAEASFATAGIQFVADAGKAVAGAMSGGATGGASKSSTKIKDYSSYRPTRYRSKMVV